MNNLPLSLSAKKVNAPLFSLLITFFFFTPFNVVAVTTSVVQNPSTTPAFKKEIQATLLGMTIPFIKNIGQTDETVEFYANTLGGTVFLTNSGDIIYSLPKSKHKAEILEKRKLNSLVAPDIKKKSLNSSGVVLRESFVKGKKAEVTEVRNPGAKVNYFIGKEKSEWKTNIPSYELLILEEMYNGIDLHLRAYGNNVEKLFHVRPGADSKRIQVKIEGADSLAVNQKGELEIISEAGTVYFTKPIAYQESFKEGKFERQYIQVAYSIDGIGYGFTLGDYDVSRELVIDPLLASTFLGGASYDNATDLVIANDGSLYVAGSTRSSDFPTTTGAYDESYNGVAKEIIISHFSADLSSLIHSTFLGGADSEDYPKLALASDGSLYVTGRTYSSDFPVTSGAYDESFNGDCDAFISHLSSDLSNLLHSTFLGGTIFDLSKALVLTTDDSVYVSGTTDSSDFPFTAGAYDESINGTNTYNIFISHLSSDLSNLLHSTFLGGTVDQRPNSIALATDGSVYIAGRTFAALVGGISFSDFPVTEGAYDESHNGGNGNGAGEDAFISHLSSDLSSLLHSTFLGGTEHEYIPSLVLASDGSVYVAGQTWSSDFPVTPGAYDESFNSASTQDDIFISHLASDLSTLDHSTFLGGEYPEGGAQLALASDGSLYVTGRTHSSDFPVTSGAYDESFNGDCDAFISHLSSDLSSLSHSTFLGGTGHDTSIQLAIANEGTIYMAGITQSSDFPVTTGAYDESYNGYEDYFISKFDADLSAENFLWFMFIPAITGAK